MCETFNLKHLNYLRTEILQIIIMNLTPSSDLGISHKLVIFTIFNTFTRNKIFAILIARMGFSVYKNILKLMHFGISFFLGSLEMFTITILSLKVPHFQV